MPDKKLLILEDHPGLGQLIKDLFTSHGYTVTLATNGQQGLDYAREGGYSAVICDIKMPILDGIGFLKNLQETPPKTKLGPIIMYSNFAYQYSKDEVLSLGAVDFIAKDAVPLEDLVKLVASHIAKHPI
jgi:two-component system response regulator AtoC